MDNNAAVTRTSAIDPRYVIVFGGCLAQFTVIGLLFSYGLFFKVFETEFGWSRTLLSSCTSLAFLTMGIFGIIAGRMNDRYGPRIVLVTVGVLYGLGYGLISQVTAPWQLFVIFGLFIGMGLGSHDIVTLSTIARWFDKRRGMMTGVVKVGTAAGQVTVPLVAAMLIVNFGWRAAFVILGGSAVVLLLISAIAVKKPPEPESRHTDTPQEGLSFAEARLHRTFWTLCAVQFLFFPTLTTIPLHIVVHGMDLGLTAALAAVLLSVIGGASVIGRLTVGTLADRIGGRRAFAMCFVPLIAALTALLFVETYWLLIAVIAVYGFAHGGFFTVVSPTVAEFFGLRDHGSIFATVLFFGTFGGALGPILAGWVFDTTGSYSIAFGTLATLAGLGLLLVLSLPAAVKK